VTKTIREHEMFRRGDTVLVAVSGGPDSVCLLYSLWYLRRLFKIRLEVFHFDHHLRRDSAKDAEYVRRLAGRLRLPFHLREAEDRPRKGRSVEAWATVRRSNAANDVRKAVGGSVTAEGHTLDDQAETVLLNLIRGTGLEGLSGIGPGGYKYGRSAYAEPLLDVERSEVEAFCRALHLRPRRDPMNTGTGLLRNAVRLDVIPSIERATGRKVKAPISRSAALLRESRMELQRAAVEAYVKVVSDARGSIRVDVDALLALPDSVASRVIRMAAYNVLALDDATAPWTREAIDAVLDLARGRVGRGRDLPDGLKARREREYVSFSRTSPESRV
jgi:tRNA(Ile)-lysidine synthase